MKVTGFSFVRNGVKYGYPFEESIRSILPLCDAFILAIGQSDDDTLSVARRIDPKIRIIDTIWDDNLKEGGQVLAKETNKALTEISDDADWAFYIQGDEVIHEKDIDTIYKAMAKYRNDEEVDGFLFKYHHFYGSFDYIGVSSDWYPHEIRIIRNDKSIYSYRDAQGFRKGNNQKLNVIPLDAHIYHYGWVRKPEVMSDKQRNFEQLYNIHTEVAKSKSGFKYEDNVRQIKPFSGNHPVLMTDHIRAQNWTFDFDIRMNHVSFKDRIKSFLKNKMGIDTGHNNYKIIKKNK